MANPSKLSILVSAVFLSTTSLVFATPAIGLTGDKTLVWFDTDNPSEVKKIEVTGIDKLVGVDVRPADKMLYGVATDGTLVTINLDSGAASAGAKLSAMLPEGIQASVDFNPMADRLRIMGSDGTNLRAHPDTGEVTTDGKLNFEPGDPNAEMKPNVIATAYLNSFGKPEKTAMYDVDASGLFLQQTKPNDGALKTIGSLGISAGDTVAFDIQTTEAGENTAWLAAGGALYQVDIATGKASKIADGVDPSLRDIAILQ